MTKRLFDLLDDIDILHRQIQALLELIAMAGDTGNVPDSIGTAAEMALNIHEDMMQGVKKLELIAREGKSRDAKQDSIQ